MEEIDTTRDWLTLAKFPGVDSPSTIAGGDQIADDTADVTLLRRVIIRPGVVSRDGHRPGVVAIMELLEEAGRVGHVLRRLEHFTNRPELRTVKIDVDLHASNVNQLGTARPGFLDQTKGLPLAVRKERLAFDVDGIGAERAFASCFR